MRFVESKHCRKYSWKYLQSLLYKASLGALVDQPRRCRSVIRMVIPTVIQSIRGTLDTQTRQGEFVRCRLRQKSMDFDVLGCGSWSSL